MEYEDTITLTGSSYYSNPNARTLVSKTYSSHTTISELLDGMKEIALGLGYSERAWDNAIQEMADEQAGNDLDAIMDDISRFENEEYPCEPAQATYPARVQDHRGSRA